MEMDLKILEIGRTTLKTLMTLGGVGLRKIEKRQADTESKLGIGQKRMSQRRMMLGVDGLHKIGKRLQEELKTLIKLPNELGFV